MATETSTRTCYRHPDRETGVSCSNCGRPICPDCMTPTPVGMRCPECARERTPVRTIRNIRAEPVVTYALIAINVVAWIAEVVAAAGQVGGGWIYEHGALLGPLIDNQGEYWRIVMRARGMDPWRSPIVGLIVINLLFSFTWGGISIGGHIGGLIGGAIAALALIEVGERPGLASVGYLLCAVIAAAAVAGSLAV